MSSSSSSSSSSSLSEEISFILKDPNPTNQTFNDLVGLHQPQDETLFTQLLNQETSLSSELAGMNQEEETSWQEIDQYINLDNIQDPDDHNKIQIPSLQELIQLLNGSPSKIILKDCSWLTKVEFLKHFGSLNTSELQVLQLDNCGCIITDETVSETLAKPNNSLSKLTSLSIVGAFDLSDVGLWLLVSSIKTLKHINVTKCITLTATSLEILADSFGSTLEELYMDNFNLIDTHRTLQALKRLKKVQVLSLAGIRNLSDDFIKDYINECGRNLNTLVLKDCVNLTDVSMTSISSVSRVLNTLDISNLGNLTDLSLEFIKTRLRELHTLKVDNIPFSDKAIAVYLDYAADKLVEVSINSNKNVGYLTAFSIAKNSKNLQTLDLSHCQNLTDRDLGMIVDGCSSLKTLTIVGCSKLTGDSLRGRANLEIRYLG